jgi:hypothetical protein
MSRLKLISLLSFNAVAAALIVALVTILLTSQDPQPLSALEIACLEERGAAETGGGLSPDSNFETVADAEAYICHRIAYPQDLGDWRIEDISAVRRPSAREVAERRGFASVTLNYVLGRSKADLRIEVSPFAIQPAEFGIVDRVPVMDTKAELIEGMDRPGHVVLQWRSSGYSFYTEAQLTDEFSLEDLLAVLNSIE